MLLESSDIEKEITKLQENITNNNKSSKESEIINKKRIWSQRSAKYFRNIIIDIDSYLKYIKQSKLLLYEADNKKKKKNASKTEEKKQIKIEPKIERKTEKRVFNKFSKYVKNIYNRIKDIKNETNEIISKDGKSLKNISLNYCRTPRPIIMDIKKEKKMRPTSASTFYESKMFDFNTNKSSRNRNMKNKQWSYKSFRTGTKMKLTETKTVNIKDLRYNNLNKLIKNSEKKGNMRRLNEMYRIKINRAINMYTPIGNLKDMKKIQLNDVNMRKNINNLNEKIRKRIENRCGGFYFKHQYEEYISKNKRNKIKESKLFKSVDDGKILPLRKQSYSTRDLLSKKLSFKKEEKKTDKEKIKEKKESFINILELLKSSLEIEPIHKYINDKSKFENRIRNDLNEDKKLYFSNLEEINNKYEEIVKENDENFEDTNINNIIRIKEILSKVLVHQSSFNH